MCRNSMALCKALSLTLTKQLSTQHFVNNQRVISKADTGFPIYIFLSFVIVFDCYLLFKCHLSALVI